MHTSWTQRLALLTGGAAMVVASGAASVVPAASALAASPAVQACAEEAPTEARLARGSSAKDPELYGSTDAKMYEGMKNSKRLPNGSVTVPTVFHMLSDHAFSAAEKARWQKMIAAQMVVLNDSYSGKTAKDASDTPFRFKLTGTTWTVNSAWYNIEPGKPEKAMKKALKVGDARTLNVYAANIADGVLGWSYFPKKVTTNGRDFMDGVVMIGETMPGGNLGDYSEGDTLTHETGHWLALEHTFENGCKKKGDHVDDTPAEAVAQYNCPDGADTCSAPGLDPIHNFMDYTQDSCMNMFTPGQAKRMSDAWVAFRANG
ncbi:pregnancy-associated plasma protein-A [Krasilnikovia cinnamomea]|uniref:Pregnancy-associated plasma protein-A n=1 Tax=Krasilnikovia cinnamomea TaxID=349313 RepID=A0A4Q7ZLI9_9ACTN|nr:zinc metalloprotease [Krasilnikovia cinnamomea]RZU51817.1 pregnancy-associated plasma protein-A [Krasilnikovia cinnamomea]